jgi:transcriptional regulator with XRE-family HTH domain
MEKKLKIAAIQAAMQEAGFSAADLAREIGVTRQAASKWLQGHDLPRPDKLLKLSLVLKLPFSQLLEATLGPEPVVAFRRMAKKQTNDEHISRAKAMGRSLAVLVDYLPFNRLVKPATFIRPSTDYGYIQDAVKNLRAELALPINEVVDFEDLIVRFRDLQAVLVPVMWGKKDRHENALHIYLPEPHSTWIFLNLDSNLIDFKFWMAHELAHVYTPDLCETDEGEDFADAFAAAFLFPKECAEVAYNEVAKLRTEATRVNAIKHIASKAVISFYTVYYELNKFADHAGKAPIVLAGSMGGAATNVAKQFPTVSKLLFGDASPKPGQYVKTIKEAFDTPFFDILTSHLKASGDTAVYLQQVMDISLADAKALHAELLG